MSPTGLLRVLLPRARRAILAELFARPDERLHLRELERRTGLNAKGLMRELHSLTDAGILTAQRSGNRVYYRANPGCPIYAELRALVQKTADLAGVLKRALEPLAGRITLAYIYGSHATGEAGPQSDIDLMLVGELALSDIASPIAEAERQLSREISPTLYALDEYRRRARDEDGFVAKVHRGAKIILLGDADEAL
ncbi:nucleotidyltransferase domain-containing protein [bacterium]|nr:nucleotidyltransferase domain-containing protein [bacterium]